MRYIVGSYFLLWIWSNIKQWSSEVYYEEDPLGCVVKTTSSLTRVLKKKKTQQGRCWKTTRKRLGCGFLFETTTTTWCTSRKILNSFVINSRASYAFQETWLKTNFLLTNQRCKKKIEHPSDYFRTPGCGRNGGIEKKKISFRIVRRSEETSEKGLDSQLREQLELVRFFQKKPAINHAYHTVYGKF